MWVALMVMLGLGFVVLRIVPPLGTTQRHDAEAAFWRSTSWSERLRLASLANRLPDASTTFASLELRRLEVLSRMELVCPRRVSVMRQGLSRDLCLVDLPDGTTLRLTVFDDRNAARFAAAWSREAELGVRLRFVEGLGWQCSLHDGVGVQATAVASVYGWLAEIDRNHHSLMR